MGMTYMYVHMTSVSMSPPPWKGQLGWIQYIPSKQRRFGKKTYKLCESSTGYVWNFIVYTGKDTIYGKRHPREKNSLRIALEVAHDLLDKG